MAVVVVGAVDAATAMRILIILYVYKLLCKKLHSFALSPFILFFRTQRRNISNFHLQQAYASTYTKVILVSEWGECERDRQRERDFCVNLRLIVYILRIFS